MESIQRYFRKFGEIESIELLSNGKKEAYVTFLNDRNAYLAIAHNELLNKRSTRQFNIQPADTWKQPINFTDNRSQIQEEFSPPFFILNEDCLLEIFKYLDFDSLVSLSEVCKLFYMILHRDIFPRYHVFTVQNSTSEIQMPLAKMRRSLMCIGPYINELQFRWHDYDHNNRLQRFLDKLGQHIGKNIRRIRFRDTLLTEDHVSSIKEVFKYLEILEITVYNPDFDLDLDFEALCPNIRKLKLLENMQLIRCCKPWPKLMHLSIVGNEYMVLSTFRSFLAQNPQLKCLKFTAYHADERLQAVAQYLKGIEKLTILPSFPNLSANNIVYLVGLEHLTKLNLMYLDEADLNGILRCLTRFVGLKVLKLHLLYDGGDDDDHYEPEQLLMIGLVQELPNLEMFSTRYIKLKESTVIDFVKYSNHLRKLHIHWCDLQITDATIWKIVKLLQTNRSQMRGVPFELFVNPSEMVGLKMTNDQKNYIQVSTKCRHTQDHAE